MAPLKRDLRYAHTDGHTDVTYDVNGQIVTAGADGDVRIWRDEDGDLEAESHRAGDRVLSVLALRDKLYSAIENNTVQVHTLPDFEPDGLATRFTAQVNHLTVSADGHWLAAGASDFIIKVLKISDYSKQKSLIGHSAPVLSVALSRDGQYCASSSCDGTVKIWKVSEEKCIHTVEDVLKKCSDISLSKTLCRIAFEGKNLLIPIGKSVHCYSFDWTKTRSFECESDVSIVCFSHCGKYLAASSIDGRIRVWKFDSKHIVLDHRHENSLNITGMKWHPKKYELTFCDSNGHFGQICNVIGDEVNPEGESLTAEQYANLFDSDDDDGFKESDVKEDKDEVMDEGDINEVLAELSDAESDTDVKDKSRSVSPDDMGSRSNTPALAAAPPIVHDCYKPTPLQRPFQSRSSPQHLSQRFMVWNSVGIVRQYQNEDENTIDIEFHDTSLHHRLTVVNDLNHRLADINTEAVLLASDDTLVCMLLSTWDNEKEWSKTMPKGESITALTLGKNFLAIGTDKRQVRLFSIGGIQRYLFSVAGPIVTLSAHSDTLAVVYHSGSGIPGDQSLSVKLIDLETLTSLESSLPLSPKCTLSFLGFSDEGGLFSMDSQGALRMLNRKLGLTWIQVCNTNDHTKGKTDNFWIVGISESQYNIRCIMCKGSTYPPVLPRPTISLLPWKIPLCTDEKSMIEENIFKSQLAQNFLEQVENEDLKHANDVMEREALMKLFALSCKQGCEFRAFEVCRLMNDQQTLQLAIKYASRLNLISLAEKLNELAREKIEEEIEKKKNDYVEMRNDDHDSDIENVNVDDISTAAVGSGLGFGEAIDSTPKCILNSPGDSEWVNPFKTESVSNRTKGSVVFDDVLKERKSSSAGNKQSPFGRVTVDLKRSTTKKQPKQKSIVLEPKPKVSAFDLWFESVKEDIEEEFPEANEEERMKTAVERFRDLDREEKKTWLNKAKQDDGKRKRNDHSDDTSNKKLCAK